MILLLMLLSSYSLLYSLLNEEIDCGLRVLFDYCNFGSIVCSTAESYC